MPLVLLLAVIFTSCEKRYLEIIPVMQIEQNLSINGAKDIKFFSFPSEQIGYAADASSYIFKTIDGGKTWNKLTVSAGGKCQGLEFFDPLNGLCLMSGDVYSTENGGLTWRYKTSGKFLGITENGKAVTGDCGYIACNIYVSSDKGKTFQSAGSVKKEGDFINAMVTGNSVFVVGDRANSYRAFYGLNLVTKASEIISFSGMTAWYFPTALLINKQKSVLVGNNGKILEQYELNSFDGTNYGHAYTYYTVDGYNDLVVAAGERTVSFNKDFNGDSKYSELLDSNGSSFLHTFYKVKFINQNSFYISGNNGLLWRVKI